MAKKNFDDDFLSQLDNLETPSEPDPVPASPPAKPKASKPKTQTKPRENIAPASQKPSSKKDTFSQQTQLTARDIAVATDDKMVVGNYKRKQILLPPNQIEHIAQRARALGMSQLALYRWMVDYALNALDEGIEPEIEVVQIRGEARKSHWSS